jgi:hypothetical protein
MKRLAAAATVLLLALAIASQAGAAPNTASTYLQPPGPHAGSTLYVTFTVYGTTPVVPYEYALQNTCVYPSKTWGNYTLGQHDDIASWTDKDADGNPQTTMPVYLQSVPEGSKCRVSLMRNNTIVKGSTQSYTVLAPLP